MNKFLRFEITRDTLIAIGAGLGMIVLSLLMIPFSGNSYIDTAVSLFLRDIVMIFGLGVVFVSLYVDKREKEILSDMGFSKHKLILSIVLDVIFAAGLLTMFMKDGIPENIFSVCNLYASSYILTAGIFEMIFIYGFLRMNFEKAFGIIPSILITSAFYSFHHAGFQPEFLHLFFVGVMYCSVFYITRNIVIIFPLFWGVGALWDVIVSSAAGEGIKNVESFAIAVIIWGMIIIWFVFRSIRRKKYVIKNIDSNNGNLTKGRNECL